MTNTSDRSNSQQHAPLYERLASAAALLGALAEEVKSAGATLNADNVARASKDVANASAWFTPQ